MEHIKEEGPFRQRTINTARSCCAVALFFINDTYPFSFDVWTAASRRDEGGMIATETSGSIFFEMKNSSPKGGTVRSFVTAKRGHENYEDAQR